MATMIPEINIGKILESRQAFVYHLLRDLKTQKYDRAEESICDYLKGLSDGLTGRLLQLDEIDFGILKSELNGLSSVSVRPLIINKLNKLMNQLYKK